MKYRCIAPFYIEDSYIMDINDIIVLKENNLYNITRKIDFTNINKSDLEQIKRSLEVITDEPIEKDNIVRFEEITSQMNFVYRSKNNDYGNSFEDSLDDEGIVAARVRMSDKWNRFKHLSKTNNSLVKEESLKDTLLDLANYAIMTIIWLDKQ